MKKVLIGLAAAAVAVAGVGGSASAGTPTESIWDIMIANMSDDATDALEDLGVRDILDDCSDRLTVFLPGYLVSGEGALGISDGMLGLEDALDGLADEFGYADIAAAIDKAGTAIKGLLAYHVVGTYYSPSTLANEYATSLKNLAGGILSISDGDDASEFSVDGIAVEAFTIPADSPVPAIPTDVYQDACNGVVYQLGANVLMPPTDPDPAGCGVAAAGVCTATPAPASGSGLPKTGSESMVLTYAALASLIAGAGVLVIRRRSIA